MHYSKIEKCDVANGPGVRVSIFLSGCRRRCKGCFNPETWDFKYGQEFTYETLAELGKLLEKPEIQGISILGGDPFEPENRDGLAKIVEFVRCFYPEKDIWCWTGFLWEDIKDLEVVKYLDVVVDGPYIEELRDLRLKFRGSSNQRIIDVWESLIEDDVVEWD